MANYYCILLDADNTLLDFDAAENKALLETFTRYELPTDAATIQLYQDINTKLWKALERGEIKRDRIMSERFGRLLEKLGADLVRGKGQDMNRYYLEQLSSHSDLIPGADDVLHELAEVATLAVVSNGFQKVQMRRIEASGLTQYLEDIFVSEKIGCDKPDRRFFDAALRQLEVENRARVLVVGDSLSSDIKGGINAGIDTCWYNPTGVENTTGITPTYEIRSLDELYKIVMEPEELNNVGNRNRKHQL